MIGAPSGATTGRVTVIGASPYAAARRGVPSAAISARKMRREIPA